MREYREIAPNELKERLDRGERPVLLDVREHWEFDVARIEGSRHLPMDEIAGRVGELEPGRETVVICHHGSRSALVARFLSGSGFENVLNLSGGLDAYSRDADPSVPRY